MEKVWLILGLWLAANAIFVTVLYLIGETVRFGIVVSWTRALLGVDYDRGLLGFYVGPIAFCIAWGPKENNPFISNEQLNEMAEKHDHENR